MQFQTSSQQMLKDRKVAKGMVQGFPKPDAKKPQDIHVEQQQKLDLSIRLQMSLETDWVISQFMEYIHAFLMFDGYSYHLGSPEVSLEFGRQSQHSCRYSLNIEDSELGELVVYRGRKFVESELMLLENFLAFLIHPLRNSIHYKQASLLAYRDALTGLNNRSTFDSTMRREISLARRHERDLSLLVIDIDHFKSVNDQFGHAVGDEVLKRVAETIDASVRHSDICYRYGGEEFVVVLTNTACDASVLVACRILNEVRNIQFQHQGSDIPLSVSIGVASLADEENSDELFNHADRALYKAKDSGRDQIKLA